MSGPSPHFTWAELGNPPESVRPAMVMLAVHVLEPMRAKLGPIRITSGYRSPEKNAAIGGAKRSQHMLGEAVDLALVKGHSAPAVLRAIHDLGLPVDQAIGYIPSEGGHVHVSYREVGGRGQYLWCDGPKAYKTWSPT